ncbi:hypothetical protein P171DRAFT_244481 [Karstenula rhodostoma CBS 690.94]|uniref:Uncharacterized protein n=1 Tax=Karstenula rhodostoma CBS 690.94 TaxID=1392251 RepID=A0A9P4PN52_9PLEO|nr:hypothetical protein P171DRAFT_244481 [Karstenula rhodostoma CBS 690.94]
MHPCTKSTGIETCRRITLTEHYETESRQLRGILKSHARVRCFFSPRERASPWERGIKRGELERSAGPPSVSAGRQRPIAVRVTTPHCLLARCSRALSLQCLRVQINSSSAVRNVVCMCTSAQHLVESSVIGGAAEVQTQTARAPVACGFDTSIELQRHLGDDAAQQAGWPF